MRNEGSPAVVVLNQLPDNILFVAGTVRGIHFAIQLLRPLNAAFFQRNDSTYVAGQYCGHRYQRHTVRLIAYNTFGRGYGQVRIALGYPSGGHLLVVFFIGRNKLHIEVGLLVGSFGQCHVKTGVVGVGGTVEGQANNCFHTLQRCYGLV